MVESGKQFMHAQGVADAVRMAAVYVPGLRRAAETPPSVPSPIDET